MSSRFKDGYQPAWCRLACQHIRGDPYHIFVLCPRFTTLQETYSQRLKTAASTILNVHELPEQDIALIIEQVSNLFSDSDVRPSRTTASYLGVLPCLIPPHHTGSIMHSRLAYDSHTISIQLADCIWGLVHQAARHCTNQQ